jgi:hypothetical protein
VEASLLSRALDGARLLVLAVVASIAVACAPDTQVFVDRTFLLNDPAANVRPPGAVELAHVSRERVTTFEGPQPAFEGHILGSDLSSEAVRAYYASQLESAGWLLEPTTIRATDELAAWWWCKERVTYRLAIKDQEKAFRPEFLGGRTFATVFDARIQSRDRAHPCP